MRLARCSGPGRFCSPDTFSADKIEKIAGACGVAWQRVDVLIVGALGGYVTWKFIGRQKFLQELRIGRITPEELKEKSTSAKSW